MLLKHRQSNKNPQLSKNNKGVTLVELIAVIAVLSVVIAAVTGFVITGAKMSSNVSGKATGSIKEQTAVEFINARILEANPEAAKVEDDSNGKKKLIIGEEATIFTNSQNGSQWVQYQYGTNAAIDLCPGEISFEYDKGSKTVTYELNGVKHIVHLRINSAGDGGNT